MIIICIMLDEASKIFIIKDNRTHVVVEFWKLTLTLVKFITLLIRSYI